MDPTGISTLQSGPFSFFTIAITIVTNNLIHKETALLLFYWLIIFINFATH